MMLLKRKGRLALIAVLGISITAFCIEYLTYFHNSTRWPVIRKSDDVAARVLFVADPQIQGEKNEHYLWGWVTRWDADWYLQKNYQLAKRHVNPDVIVFLGDLFDEGSIASDPEYRRYFQRFRNIFDLPTNKDPSPIKHIFMPGDNDVGGERYEPVDPVKVNWFSKTFGDLRAVVNFSERGLDIQFVKMNLFMPKEYKDPMRGFHNVINGTKKPDIRLIVSHVSLLSFMTNSVEQVLESFQPNLIIAAHSHKSSYLRLVKGEKRTVHIIHDFLQHKKSQGKTTEATIPDNRELLTQSSLILDLNSIPNQDIHEIVVPTCSYRMGVYEMGYGAMQLYRNGTMEYTVLWLPSRFKQLFLYIVIYVIMKLIITPWILWKICVFACWRCRNFRIMESGNQYLKIV